MFAVKVNIAMIYWRWCYVTCWILFAGTCTWSVDCATLNDTQTLLEDLLHNYSIEVRPALDQDQSVNVTVLMPLKSIQGVDEVKEVFMFYAALYIGWSDPRMSWTPSLYGGIRQVTVSYSKVWVPELVLTNPSDVISGLGQTWQRVRYLANGSANWTPSNLFNTDCPINAQRFPFDTQTCPVSFTALGYTAAEISLTTSVSNPVILQGFSGNGEWDIVRTEAGNTVFGRSASEITFRIHLKRKPEFIVINIIIPIMFLCCLSSFAFLLVPESGERVSFCVTVFLSISVFLTIISDILPKTSEPVPTISYTLMLSTALSSTTSIIAILNLRLYHREDQFDVPQWLQRVYIAGMRFQLKKNKVQAMDREGSVTDKTEDKSGWLTHDKPEDENVMQGDTGHETLGYHLKSAESEDNVQVTWRSISTMIDNVAFMGFTLAGLVIFAWFLVATLA